MKRVLGYGALTLITAPIWVPAAFVGYLGYKGAKFAFKNPKTTVAGLIAAGMMSYCASERSDEVRQGLRSTVTEVTSAYAQRNDLEERLELMQAKAAADQQTQERLRHELARSTIRMRVLEDRVNAYRAPAGHTQVPAGSAQAPMQQAAHGTDAARRDAPPQPTPLETMRDPAFFFYYVKMDDTLEGIARKIGTPGTHAAIAHDNGVSDPRKLLTGQLLRLRKEFCMRYNDDVYEQVPKLRSSVIPGQYAISEACDPRPRCGPELLALNNQLGLNYKDTFPYKQGARVIYYR